MTEATRRQGETESILDLVLTNNPDCIEKITLSDGIADHDNVIIDLDIAPKTKRRVSRKVYIRKKADTDSIKEAMEDLQKEYFDSSGVQNLGPNDKWVFVQDRLVSIMDKFIPSKMSSTRYNLPWFDAQLRKQCRKKKKLYNKAKKSGKTDDWKAFAEARKIMKKNLRQARAKYQADFLESSLKDDPKSFWTYVKDLRKEHQGIADLKSEDHLVSDNKTKADILNKQFSSVFTKEGPGEIPSLGVPYPSIENLVITTEGVETQLQKLDPSKSQGPDNLPPWFLKMIAADLAPIFRDLFQASVDTGEVPEQWKSANITALFKKGNRAEASNYRPVSLTVVACKILEHIIHSHVMKHLEKHHILTDQQHGFRAKRSTETQLILTNHDIASELNSKKEVDVAILDFSKAFDKVPHRRLSYKLSYYGITGCLLTWIENFLIGRVQHVLVDGQSSDPAPVDSGVPQGTVTGPLWFLLYIKDLPYQLKSTCRLFADDCLIYALVCDSEGKSSVLQDDLIMLEKWQDDWMMQFNPSKCTTMSIATRNPTKRIYDFCGQQLESVDSHPYLGVEMTNTLSWGIQTSLSIKKAQRAMGVIKRNLADCNQDVKVTTYQSYCKTSA